jgi:integrase
MRPGEVDLEDAVWVVPAERMKGGREHRVPLSPAAVALLESLPKSEHYVFHGQSPARPLSNMAMLSLLDRMGLSDLTVHGFRSTFRDWAAERTSFPREVCEMALAHTISNETEAAYRRGDLFDKRRRLMEAWAEFLRMPATGAKVLTIKHTAAAA